MKTISLIWLLTINQLGFGQFKEQTTGEPTSYIITIDREDPFKIRVKASFNTVRDTLYIHSGCPSYDYPEGWSTFIQPMDHKLRFVGNSKWVLEGDEANYSIDLSFVQHQWPAGNEQAGIYMQESMFVVTRALFLYDNQDEKFEVTIKLPKGYMVGAPWLPVGQNQFKVKSLEELNNNTLVWGKQPIEKISIDDFNLHIALLGYSPEVGKLVNSTFQNVLKRYLELFPRTPPANYLITAFPYEQNDGEAYTTSNAFTLKLPITEQTKLMWSGQFAHELFHFWNGKMINGPDRKPRQWFSEGYTEYFANLAVLREGIISLDDFYRLVEKTIGLYYYFRIRQYDEISLADAGDNKTTYRFGVYNGGWVAAFVMDMMIREKHPDKSLEDFMNQLFETFGLTGKSYALEDLQNLSTEFLEDNGEFFLKYISGLEVLPLEYYMNKLGILTDIIPYEGVTFLFEDPEADERQQKLREQWLYGK